MSGDVGFFEEMRDEFSSIMKGAASPDARVRAVRGRLTAEVRAGQITQNQFEAWDSLAREIAEELDGRPSHESGPITPDELRSILTRDGEYRAAVGAAEIVRRIEERRAADAEIERGIAEVRSRSPFEAWGL